MVAVTRRYPTYRDSLESIVAEAEATPATRVDYEVYLDDALEWLERAQPNSIHAVVTDPPYGVLEYTPKQLENRLQPVRVAQRGEHFDERTDMPSWLPAVGDQRERLPAGGGQLLEPAIDDDGIRECRLNSFNQLTGGPLVARPAQLVCHLPQQGFVVAKKGPAKL